MARFIHLLGKQGSGKTTIAVALAAQFQARGLVCANVDGPHTEFVKDRVQALALWPRADVIFLEHAGLKTLLAALGPGDQVIHAAEIGLAGFPCRDLRPADWHLIWPELIGAEGAPEVPATAATGEGGDA